MKNIDIKNNKDYSLAVNIYMDFGPVKVIFEPGVNTFTENVYDVIQKDSVFQSLVSAKFLELVKEATKTKKSDDIS